jgi:DNA mismatch endonuclease (patch repair protein)
VTDTVSPEKRSAMMAAVRSKNTTPELIVRRAVHRLGFRFRLHDKKLPGKPDLVLRKWRTVIFVNGCFWHRHSNCKKATTPKSNEPFWMKKFGENKRRDRLTYKVLARLGWKVIVIWQCETALSKELSAALKRHFIDNRGSGSTTRARKRAKRNSPIK